MSLHDFLSALDSLVSEASEAFDSASDEESLELARVRYLGQKSERPRDIQKQMGTIDQDDRKAAGLRLNESKSTIQEAFNASKARLGKGTRRRSIAPLIPRFLASGHPSGTFIPSRKRFST